MSAEGRARSAAMHRAGRVAGVPEYDVIDSDVLDATGFGRLLSRRALEGWRLVGPVVVDDGAFVATMQRARPLEEPT